MVTDQQTNIVYFSDLLRTDTRFAETCKRISAILNKHHIKYGFLNDTKDIWCRDYMPVQKGINDIIQFRYEPSYLKDDPDIQSDPKEVCASNNLKPIFSNINLDGGNVIKWSDKVIISDRIYSENPEYGDKSQLISELEKLFEAQIIILPSIHTEETGHADGMVRFYNSDTILINDLEEEYKYWSKGMKRVLQDYKLKHINVPFINFKDKKHPLSAIGCYLNFLEVSNLIVLPIFDVTGNEDKLVSDLFKSIYPDRIIETININEIGSCGGLMNCISWNVYSPFILKQ
jgi:agmatine deiminase